MNSQEFKLRTNDRLRTIHWSEVRNPISSNLHNCVTDSTDPERYVYEVVFNELHKMRDIIGTLNPASSPCQCPCSLKFECWSSMILLSWAGCILLDDETASLRPARWVTRCEGKMRMRLHHFTMCAFSLSFRWFGSLRTEYGPRYRVWTDQYMQKNTYYACK